MRHNFGTPLAVVLVIPWPVLVYAAMSGVTFGVYWMDKQRAVRGKWRISERTLHLLEFSGGWPGAFVAQRALRHKNRKGSYQAVYWGIVAVHVAFWAWRLGWVRA